MEKTKNLPKKKLKETKPQAILDLYILANKLNETKKIPKDRFNWN